MNQKTRMIALLLSAFLALSPVWALAETAEETVMIPEGMEVEGMASEEEETQADFGDETASIEGLKPLYTTTIKPFTSNGTTIRMRAKQSSDSDVLARPSPYMLCIPPMCWPNMKAMWVM